MRDLARMMGKLAPREPALPFDERAVEQALGQFLANPEIGRARLLGK
jgi:hypothetical protein